jgi:hypothetical protein
VTVPETARHLFAEDQKETVARFHQL